MSRLSDDEIRATMEAATPGSWGVEQTPATNWIGPMRECGDGKVASVASQTDRYALREDIRAQNDANARLIAAAPDLAREVLELRAEVATHRQRELAEAMSNISEDYYCAGWLIGLEFSLWAMVQGGSRDFGLGAVSEDDVAELRRLSERCGGWIARGGESPVFMPMADWLKHYEAKKGRP